MICEDEEKYFDRVTPEVQLTDMAAIGMPDFGWTELKNKTTTDRECKLITNLEIIDLLYDNGSAQGCVSSAVICNLCANFKLTQWTKEDDNNLLELMQGYIFATTYHLDLVAGRHLNLHKNNCSDDTAQSSMTPTKSLQKNVSKDTLTTRETQK